MTQRYSLCILFCTIISVSAQAQLSKQDSIKLHQLLKGNSEININMEAVKDIHFDFNPSKELMKSKPLMSNDKPWMKFVEDLPKNYNDTAKWVKPKYIRLTPYTAYTKWNEDPVNDPIFLKKDSLKLGNWTLILEKTLGIKNGFRVVPSGMDQSVTPSNNPLGTFDANALLSTAFSKKWRTIQHNRKHANAWKTYNAYIPTTMDSLILNLKQLPLKKDSSEKSKSINDSVRKSIIMNGKDSIEVKVDSIIKRSQKLLKRQSTTSK